MSVTLKETEHWMEEHQGLVHSVAWKMRQSLPEHIELDDLVGYGQIGLAEAAQSYDPERGVQFSTFAYYRIRGAIYDGLAKMSWFSRSQYRQVRYAQLAEDLLRVDSENVTEAEANDREDSEWLCGLTSSLAVVYLSTESAEDDSSGDDAVADVGAEPPSSRAMSAETSRLLHQLVESLPAESGSLIRHVYFEGLTLQEAGRRIGVSKAWASRLHAKTLTRLAHSLRSLGEAD